MHERIWNIGGIGIGLGGFALLLVLVHFWAGPFAPQIPLEQSIAEKAVAIRDATVAALKGEVRTSVSRPQWDIDRLLQVVGAALGGLAIVLGVISFANREPRRIASGAAILGASAIAFQFAAVAIGALVVAILLAVVISQLGFGELM